MVIFFIVPTMYNAMYASSKKHSATQHEKLVMLGETCVGKSCILMNFIHNETTDQSEPTIGAAFMSKKVVAQNGITICLEIWDTAGQERYKSLAPMYYRGATSAIIAMDVTNVDSFYVAKNWAREVISRGAPDCHLVFAVNKTDICKSQWEFTMNEVELYLNELQQDTGRNVKLYSTSAKTDTKSIVTMFTDIVEMMSVKPKLGKDVASEGKGVTMHQPETMGERLSRSFGTIHLIGTGVCTIL
jgi:Ras-related protein Rab-5C